MSKGRLWCKSPRDYRPFGEENPSPTDGMTAAAILAFFLAAAIAGSAVAQDTVHIAGSTGGRTKITGRVLDYTGRELQLEHPGGRTQAFPAEKVLKIETQYGRQHTEADALSARAEFQPALALYGEARENEPRAWVRRQITARIVRCWAALGHPDRAGAEFLLLIREDPNTPHFDCIPLAWMPRQPSVALERAARQWILRDEPAAVLLGASHLLSSASRSDALRRLRQLELAAGPDRRVAQLALAQTWQAEVINATDERLAAWSRAIEQMPESLAAGPYFVLGRARLQQEQWEGAALALMRVAILYPQHRALAAEALVQTGRSLEKLGRPKEAVRLYRELIRTYPQETRPVAEAESRMEAMRNDP